MFGLEGLPKKKTTQPAPRTYKTAKVAVVKAPEPLPSVQSSRARKEELSKERDRSSSARPRKDRSQYPTPETPGTPESDRLMAPSRKRKAERQITPVTKFDTSSDEDEGVATPGSTGMSYAVKRPRDDSKRTLRESRPGKQGFVHAADVQVDKTGEGKEVGLRYPSSSVLERYKLIFGKDQIHPADEISQVAKIVADCYLPPDQQTSFLDPDSGLVRQIQKTGNIVNRFMAPETVAEFQDAVNNYNEALNVHVHSKVVAEQQDNWSEIPGEVVKYLLKQVYERTVSPNVDFLKNKSDNKDNTYGELNHIFVSTIIEETSLKSSHVFLDLGSGVGNVVLQAALEAGCESYGCEMMPTASTIAKSQEREFKARCRLWGIRPGAVHLEQGDFKENEKMLEVIKRADVILVNNEVFGPELNDYLKCMFLDAKIGCRVVSLKSFEGRQENDIFNGFLTRKMRYWNNYVSWKGDGGSYYIATKRR